MLKIPKFIFVVIPILILILVNPIRAYGGWYEDESGGTWELKSDVHWKTQENNEDAHLYMINNLTGDFSLWDVKIKGKAQITGIGALWHYVDLSVGNDSEYVMVTIKYNLQIVGWLFGLIQAQVKLSGIMIGKIENNVIVYKENLHDFNEFYVYRVVFLRVNASAIRVICLAFTDETQVNAVWKDERTILVNASAFNYPDVFLEQDMSKVYATVIGGYIEGWKSGEMIRDDGYYYTDYSVESVLGFWDSLKAQIWNSITGAWYGLTSWASENLAWLGNIYEYLSFGLSFIPSIFKVATNVLPLILLIYPVWLMMVGVQCVTEGSIDPLMSHFMGIYHFFANLITMILNVAQTIWDYIKFW